MTKRLAKYLQQRQGKFDEVTYKVLLKMTSLWIQSTLKPENLQRRQGKFDEGTYKPPLKITSLWIQSTLKPEKCLLSVAACSWRWIWHPRLKRRRSSTQKVWNSLRIACPPSCPTTTTWRSVRACRLTETSPFAGNTGVVNSSFIDGVIQGRTHLLNFVTKDMQ